VLPEIRFDGDNITLLDYYAPIESSIARVSARTTEAEAALYSLHTTCLYEPYGEEGQPRVT
jgi:hypothetical protein